jgi:hypothetical protein
MIIVMKGMALKGDKQSDMKAWYCIKNPEHHEARLDALMIAQTRRLCPGAPSITVLVPMTPACRVI